jgi:hypothetical protein
MTLLLGFLVYFGCMALVALPIVAVNQPLLDLTAWWRRRAKEPSANSRLTSMIDSYLDMKAEQANKWGDHH